MSLTWGFNSKFALRSGRRPGRALTSREATYHRKEKPTVPHPRVLRDAIYNVLALSMSRVHASSRQLLDCILVVLILIAIPHALAADWSEPERQLAQKIGAATGPGAVFLDVINLASYGKSDVEAIRRGLSTQLSALGIQLVKSDQASATVQVSLTQNIQDHVWVAEIRQGTAPPTIVMVTMARSGPSSSAPRPAGLSITRTLLWTQSARILDAAVVEISGSPTYLLILDSSGVRVAHLDHGQWKEQQFLPIEHPRPWPRDLRGRLVLRHDRLFDAYLPGVSCSSGGGASVSLTCRASDDPWPLAGEAFAQNAFFTPSRNFFTGVLVPGVQQESSVGPFYSAAPVPKSNYTLWLFATVDGSLQLVDGMTKQSMTGLGWGSDIGTVRSSCGSGFQVLAASNVDNAADAIRAFEFADREPVPVTPIVEFPGPVTALWTETAGAAAVAVVQNLESDRYEAYRLSISCSQ